MQGPLQVAPPLVSGVGVDDLAMVRAGQRRFVGGSGVACKEDGGEKEETGLQDVSLL
ncbi:hypothetical protein LP419_20635 [Massilia sp. H-1]|nr:hypothetical protein LP419_20635 [Massilia sp. H-1]